MPSVDVGIAVDHPSFAGHFPGRPILPGVAILAEVIEAMMTDESTVQALGTAPRLGAVKFVAACGPGDMLRIGWEMSATRIAFQVRRAADDTLAASGHFEIAASSAKAAA